MQPMCSFIPSEQKKKDLSAHTPLHYSLLCQSSYSANYDRMPISSLSTIQGFEPTTQDTSAH